MKKRNRSARAVRILSGIVSMTTIMGSFMGTGLTAYAGGEGVGYSLTTTGSSDGTVLKNTWKKIDGKWYFFGKDGSMAVNRWVKDNGKWYYLCKDGAMVTGWKKIDGKWYFFGKDGSMAVNRWVKDNGKWYYLCKDGAMVTGWKKIDGKWYFFGKDGSMAVNRWVKDNGKWYYLGKNGAMHTGWISYKDVWYFLKKAGDMATDWQKIKGTWYYFDSDGRMYSNAYIDRKYFVDENGAWDGVTITDIPGTEPVDPVVEDEEGTTTLKFHQDGWYVARLEVQVWDKSKEDFVWIYSDSCAKGENKNVKIDTDRYEIHRVGYQIWFFGWDNDYMNILWENTDYSKDFTLSGYGDYPDFTWK